MKTYQFKDKDDWMEARLGKVTGTRLKDIIEKRGGARKIGFYEIIAERVAVPADNENVMDRGKRLEEFAIERFEKETKKKVNKDLVIWCRDDNEDIAISPDGFIGKKEAVEVKCLSSARHLEAYLTKKLPSEYEEQALQYFIVNDDLKTLYFCFFDPRMPMDFFYLEIKRADVAEKVVEYLELEKRVLEEIKQIQKDLTF